MRNKLFICLLVFGLLIFLLSGCKTETSEPPAAGEEGQGEEAPAEEVLVLTFGGTTPPGISQSVAYENWMNKVEELSEGRVKFDRYWSWGLIPTLEEIPKGVVSGVADVHAFFFDHSLTPLNSGLSTMPFMGWPSVEVMPEIWKKLHDKFPEMRKEIEDLGLKLYGSGCSAPGAMSFKDRVVKTPDDLKGVKYAMVDLGPLAEIHSMAGGTPVQVGFGDLYMAIERGMADGSGGPNGSSLASGIIPLLPYVTVFGEEWGKHTPIVAAFSHIVMGIDFYNNLPPDIRAIFDELEPFLSEELAKAEMMSSDVAMKEAEKLGHNFTYLTREELKVWEDFAIPIHEKWIEEMEAQGKPARAIYEEAKRLIEEYR